MESTESSLGQKTIGGVIDLHTVKIFKKDPVGTVLLALVTLEILNKTK